jgi:hypothetical protein
MFDDTTDQDKDRLREVLALPSRLRNNEVTVACPRLIRPGLTEIPCEADIRVWVHGQDDEDAALEEYAAPCGHTLTDAEEGLVLDDALERLADRARARRDAQADYAYDHYGHM